MPYSNSVKSLSRSFQPCHSLLVGARPHLKQKESSRRNLICHPCRLRPLTNCKLVAQVGQRYRYGVRSRCLSKPIAVYQCRPSFQASFEITYQAHFFNRSIGHPSCNLHAPNLRQMYAFHRLSSCTSTFVDKCMPCPPFSSATAATRSLDHAAEFRFIFSASVLILLLLV